MTELSTFLDATRWSLRKLMVIQAPVKYSRPGFRQSLEEGEELVMAERFRGLILPVLIVGPNSDLPSRSEFGPTISWWAMGGAEKFEIK
jgi:hypothetical protein